MMMMVKSEEEKKLKTKNHPDQQTSMDGQRRISTEFHHLGYNNNNLHLA